MAERSMPTFLSEHLKLKGEEKYAQWSEAIIDIINANSLGKHVHEQGMPPEEVDEFGDIVDEEKLKTWQKWDSGNALTRFIIRNSCKAKTASTLSIGETTARKMWVKLESLYKGAREIVLLKAVKDFFHIKYNDNYGSLEEFTIAFNRAVQKLKSGLEEAVPEA